MTDLVISDLDDDVINALETRASESGLTLTDYLTGYVADYVTDRVRGADEVEPAATLAPPADTADPDVMGLGWS